MAWFKRNNEEDTTPKVRDEKMVLTFRGIAAVYLLYLAYDTIMNYVNGNPENSELWLVIAASAFLIIGGGVVGILTIRDFKRYKQRQEEEAAAAAAEEAAAAEAAAQAETAEEETAEVVEETSEAEEAAVEE